MSQHSDNAMDTPGACGPCPEIDVYAPCCGECQEINIWPPMVEWPDGDGDPNWMAIKVGGFDEIQAAVEKAKAFLAGHDDTGV
ncbi:MAG: hypothetical protein KDD28_15435 [Phaeodactylibacter sp.]|nr:hypothetical protein [Phaeodactylibacter sp.]HQU61171.1 hypothetical protein [Saprospiraceae bacterium]